MQTSPFFATERRRNQIKLQLFCKLFLHYHKDPNGKRFFHIPHSRSYDLLSIVYWREWRPSH